MTEEETKATASEIEFWQRLALCFMSKMDVTQIVLEPADISKLHDKFNGELPALAVTIQTNKDHQFVELHLCNPQQAAAFTAELEKTETEKI